LHLDGELDAAVGEPGFVAAVSPAPRLDQGPFHGVPLKEPIKLDRVAPVTLVVVVTQLAVVELTHDRIAPIGQLNGQARDLTALQLVRAFHGVREVQPLARRAHGRRVSHFRGDRNKVTQSNYSFSKWWFVIWFIARRQTQLPFTTGWWQQPWLLGDKFLQQHAIQRFHILAVVPQPPDDQRR